MPDPASLPLGQNVSGRREITTPPPGLVPVWRMQWAEPRALREWGESGVPFITAGRLERMVNDAYKHGWQAGEGQGRANLRTAVENGTVEPIGPVKQP